MFSVRDSIPHRLVGLFLAVLMPLCCCTTQVFGDAVLNDGDRAPRAATSCCSHCVDAATPESGEPANPHDRCDCVRGQLGGGVETSTIIGMLAIPAIAHPTDTATGQRFEVELRLEPIPTVSSVPPDDPGTTPCARRLRRVVVLQT